LKWDEIDLARGVLTIPGTRTKSRNELRIALPEPALEIIRAMPRRADRQYLFGERGGEYSRWGFAKQAIDRRLAEAGHQFKRWTLHDLRRTARTKLSELGIAPHVAELVLNHIGHRGSVDVSVYDKHHYQSEIKDALQKWADALTKIVEGGPKVVPIRATV
jgi:integrase